MKSKLLLLILTTLALSACNLFIKEPQEIESIVSQKVFRDSKQFINEIVGKKIDIIPTITENSLYFTNTHSSETFKVYDFQSDERASTNDISRYNISPTNRFVVWYSPIKGFISLDLKTQQTTTVYPASEFLNINPYISFLEDEDTVTFISEDGNIFNSMSLVSGDKTETPIPFPYGNLFRISPDKKNILFIAGYGQSQVHPKYMFTDITGRFQNDFETETDIADRHLAVWAPDSSGVIIVNSYKLEIYPLINPETPQLILEIPNQKHIVDLYRKGDNIFALDKDDYWHVYSYSQEKRIAMTPISIASDLKKPQFTPWSETQFIIQETITENANQFSRLWLSDFKGTKHLVIPSYNPTVIKTEPLIVE